MVCEECVKTSNHNPLCLGAPCDIQIRPERSSRENTSHQQQQQQSLRQHAAKCCVVAVDDYRFSIRCLSFSPSCFIFMHLRNINQLKIKKANHYWLIPKRLFSFFCVVFFSLKNCIWENMCTSKLWVNGFSNSSFVKTMRFSFILAFF